MAQYINLIYFIPTSIISIIIFTKQKLIDYKLVGSISMAGIVGAILGAKISSNIGTNVLKKAFALFLIVIAIFESISWYKKYIKKA